MLTDLVRTLRIIHADRLRDAYGKPATALHWLVVLDLHARVLWAASSNSPTTSHVCPLLGK